jgi:hypothetical protein
MHRIRCNEKFCVHFLILYILCILFNLRLKLVYYYEPRLLLNAF